MLPFSEGDWIPIGKDGGTPYHVFKHRVRKLDLELLENNKNNFDDEQHRKKLATVTVFVKWSCFLIVTT